MDLKELQKRLDKIVNKKNNRPVPEFEGFSPNEMHQIISFTYSADSPLKLQTLTEPDYDRIPLLNQIKYLMNLIEKEGEMKLTGSGYLPPKIVLDLYHQGFLQEEVIELGITRLHREADSLTVNLTKLLIVLAGLIKKRHGKLSLTQKSRELLGDDEKLLRQILMTFTNKFNWAYYDHYAEQEIGQLGYGFTLILLSKYGHESRLDSFYAEKYFKAFPGLRENIEPLYGTLEDYTTACYSLRTFERFLNYLGVITLEDEGARFLSRKRVTKTDLFDKLIKIMPPAASRL